MKKNDGFVTYRQNPKIDFLFGYFGEIAVPTKQGVYKPVEMIETNENGTETILKDFYVKKPETNAIAKFKKYIKQLLNKISMIQI